MKPASLQILGVPMIFPVLPPMVGLIIPVFIIEVLYTKETLSVIRKRRRYSGILIANIVFTFIGWPLAWVTLVAIELATGGGSGYRLKSPIQILLTLTLGAARLVPYIYSVLSCLIPSAMVVLLIPFSLFPFIHKALFFYLLGSMWSGK